MQQDLLSDLIGRIRINESKISTLRERLLTTDQNMLAEYRKIIRDMKNLNFAINSLKKELAELRELINSSTKELSQFARKEELNVLEKYINLWNPLHFTTEKEVEKIFYNLKKDAGTEHQN